MAVSWPCSARQVAQGQLLYRGLQDKTDPNELFQAQIIKQESNPKVRRYFEPPDQASCDLGERCDWNV